MPLESAAIVKPWSSSELDHPVSSQVLSTTPISVRPFRVAAVTSVRPALSVCPVFSPIAPGYVFRNPLLWFSNSRATPAGSVSS